MFYFVGRVAGIKCFLKRYQIFSRAINFAVNYADLLVFLKKGAIAGVINEQEICTPELIKTVFDVDVQMSLNPQTGKPFFMPFRAREEKAL